MINFNIITIFPEALEGYFDSSILKRAREKKLIKIKLINPRDFAKDKHKATDDKPFGGGPGMVFKAEPMIKAVVSAISNSKFPISKQIPKPKPQKTKVIFLAPGGKQFNQRMAKNLAKKYDNLVLVSGRYEGIDARVEKAVKNLKLKTENLSIGPYVLTGGELPAAVVVDAVSRNIPGVLGKRESLEDERGIGIPVYTRPEVFQWPPKKKGGEEPKKYRVPKILLSGHHKKIQEWRAKRAK